MILQHTDFLKSISSNLGQTLESMAFIAFDDSKLLDQRPPVYEDMFVTSVEIGEPERAKIMFMASEDFGRELHESIVGEQLERYDATVVSDTLNEFVNTFCGRFASEIFGDEVEFKLGIPETIRATSMDFSNLDNENCYIIEFSIVEEKVYCIFYSLKE